MNLAETSDPEDDDEVPWSQGGTTVRVLERSDPTDPKDDDEFAPPFPATSTHQQLNGGDQPFVPSAALTLTLSSDSEEDNDDGPAVSLPSPAVSLPTSNRPVENPDEGVATSSAAPVLPATNQPAENPAVPAPALPTTNQPGNQPAENSVGASPAPNRIWHAPHLTIRDARSPAARRAIQGTPEGPMANWLLEDVLVFDPKKPPSCLKKTRGSKEAYFDQDGKQVKEVWRCKVCDAGRKVDPTVTNAMTSHTRKKCPSPP
ncbi:hypothetical protein CF326_g9372 [Tilletia indica]|nr:hypothetical protein CF326_g9372 [Tilletia indica]